MRRVHTTIDKKYIVVDVVQTPISSQKDMIITHLVSKLRYIHLGGRNGLLSLSILFMVRVLRPRVTLVHKAHLRGIVTMRFKVFTECSVLLYHAIVRKGANEEKGDQCAEYCKAATDPKRPCIATVGR